MTQEIGQSLPKVDLSKRYAGLDRIACKEVTFREGDGL